MKIHLLQELIDLNQAFENVICGLERMEKVTLFDKEHVRYTRAEVESARVDANREFFDKFDTIVENDAKWAYEFRRAYDQKTEDPFDIYLDIKEREEARRKQGLPPRVVLLPDWDKDDPDRYDEERSKKRAAGRARKISGRRKPWPAKTAKRDRTGATRAPERKN